MLGSRIPKEGENNVGVGKQVIGSVIKLTEKESQINTVP